MILRLTAPVLTMVVLVSGPIQTARAEPITIGSILLSWVIGQGVTSIWDTATNKPNVREMKRQLDALAASDRANSNEIRRLRDSLNEKMDRKQVEDLIMQSLSRVDKQLAELAARMKAAEDRVKDLESENKLLRERVARVELRTDQHSGVLDNHGRRLDGHDLAISEVQAKLKEHEERIRKLELTVGPMGADGFTLLDRDQTAKALEKFDEALTKDRGDPGLYYGKAMALNRLGRSDEAKRTIAIGVEAERERAPGKWYRDSLSKIQGHERSWFEDTRNFCRTNNATKRE